MLRYFRRRDLLDEADAQGMLSWQGAGGFSIDASVCIQGDDRQGVERLVRCCARPPFALERLHAPTGAAALNSPDARLLYRFPKPTPDGRTQIQLSSLQLLERLAAFVPPPRVHRNRYHGVAVLLARIYQVLPLLCPACGGQMNILACLTDPPVVRTILLHLELPHLPPPMSPARGPPQGDLLLDQTPGFDPASGEPASEFVFDQSLPDDFDD